MIIIRSILSILFVAAIAAVFSISFAAIIYTGDLSQFLSRGIGLVLLGNVIMALIGAAFLSYRGSVALSQDAPAVLISGAAIGIVAQGQLAGDALFASVVGLLFLTAFCTGLAAVIFAKLKLAFIARFIPYPVLGGFLAATGLLLVLGALGVATGAPVDLSSVHTLFEVEVLVKWGPWFCVAAVILIVMNRSKWALTLPVFALMATAGFYLVLYLSGITLDDAEIRGWLLGPFQKGGFTDGLNPSLISEVDIGAIFTQIPTVLAVVALSLIAMALNISGLEIEVKQDIDINRDMAYTGRANMIAAFGGGLVGYHMVSLTLLARQLGTFGPMAGISVALGNGLALLFGAAVLSALPIGIFAAVIALMGMDLLYTWIWVERRKFNVLDYILVLTIPLIAISYGFLVAVGVGLFLAAVQFIINYAKLDVVRLQTTLANRRSFVERPESELQTLARYGQDVLIIKLTGYLFFGSASALRERVLNELKSGDLTHVMLDFESVQGVDISAGQALQKINEDCSAASVALVVSELHKVTQMEWRGGAPLEFTTIEPALNQIEQSVLASHPEERDQSIGFFEQLQHMYPHVDFDEHVDRIELSAGEMLVDHGDESDDIYLLQSGSLNVLVPDKNGGFRLVAQVRAGALVGEIAHYADAPRSARIEANDSVKLIRFDASKLDNLSVENPRFFRDFHLLAARHLARRLMRTTQLLRDVGV